MGKTIKLPDRTVSWRRYDDVRTLHVFQSNNTSEVTSPTNNLLDYILQQRDGWVQRVNTIEWLKYPTREIDKRRGVLTIQKLYGFHFPEENRILRQLPWMLPRTLRFLYSQNSFIGLYSFTSNVKTNNIYAVKTGSLSFVYLCLSRLCQWHSMYDNIRQRKEN